MARIRTIKPEFFTSLTIADLPLTARLTFIGLWTHVDDAGRCVDDPRLIKAAVWPLDDRTASDIELDLKLLSEASLITRYVLTRKRYIAVTGWGEHQRINRPTPSKLPAPDQGEPTPPEPVTRDNSDSLNAHAPLTEDSPPERKGKEGKGTGKGKESSAEADGESEPIDPDDSDFVGATEDPDPIGANTIVAEWIDRCTKRPPGNVIGRVAKQIKKLLDEDIDADDIRRGLSRWMTKGADPSSIPSFVNEAMNAGPPATFAGSNVLALHGPRPSTTDARVQAALDLGRQMQAEHDAAHQEAQ
ncbi:hypothetical protein [Streptomyces sp. NPDC060001]|uniref:hypothetical protein n=1 Tax=Streptomyces sp. NPDC060001 TaxID=3347032 RepID=UPI00369A7B46